jgi:hypothetical protein
MYVPHRTERESQFPVLNEWYMQNRTQNVGVVYIGVSCKIFSASLVSDNNFIVFID